MTSFTFSKVFDIIDLLSTEKAVFLSAFSVAFFSKNFMDNAVKSPLESIANASISGAIYSTCAVTVTNLFLPKEFKYIAPILICGAGVYHLSNNLDFNNPSKK